jgi:hypothetical protein
MVNLTSFHQKTGSKSMDGVMLVLGSSEDEIQIIMGWINAGALDN